MLSKAEGGLKGVYFGTEDPEDIGERSSASGFSDNLLRNGQFACISDIFLLAYTSLALAERAFQVLCFQHPSGSGLRLTETASASAMILDVSFWSNQYELIQQVQHVS